MPQDLLWLSETHPSISVHWRSPSLAIPPQRPNGGAHPKWDGSATALGRGVRRRRGRRALGRPLRRTSTPYSLTVPLEMKYTSLR